MSPSLSTLPQEQSQRAEDEWLFGWDAKPGIVSVWASREGAAVIWRRAGSRVACETARFRPWLFAAGLADLARETL